MNNTLIARVLIANKLVTEDQVRALWGQISVDKNIAQVCIENGLIAENLYAQLMAYVQKLANDPKYNTASSVSTTGESSSASAASVQSETTQVEISQSAHIPEKAKNENVVTQVVQEQKESVIAKNQLLTGNYFFEDEIQPVTTSQVNVEIVQSLESTQMSAPPQYYIEENVGQEKVEEVSLKKENHTSHSESTAKGVAVLGALPVEFRGIRGDGPRKQVNGEINLNSSLEEVLIDARNKGASDVHLSPNNPIVYRIYGSLQGQSQAVLSAEKIHSMLISALPNQLFEILEKTGDVEGVLPLEGAGRYRITVIKQRSGWDFTARVIPTTVPSFEESGMPEVCRGLTKWAQGLVLVTGPVGCGKTLTLSTLVNMVNQDRKDHIITIESPIEIPYPEGNCQITQREVKMHTMSEANALKGALRQDPDILVVSELRDPESVQLALSAAETGHLVFGTMNTTNAMRTISRLVDSFPPEEQGVVRNMLSESLRGVISQQLIPKLDGYGQVTALEVLIVNHPVANLIRKDEMHQLESAMITGKSQGMIVLDDSLTSLVEQKIIDPKEAYYRATNPKNFEKYLTA